MHIFAHPKYSNIDVASPYHSEGVGRVLTIVVSRVSRAACNIVPKTDAPGNNVTVSFPALIISLYA